jgi:hypothetical protein
MKAHTGKHKKDEGRLMGVAKSIGSTIGTIVGRATAAQNALTHSTVPATVKHEGKTLMRKSKKAGRKIKHSTPAGLKRSKLARAIDRG